MPKLDDSSTYIFNRRPGAQYVIRFPGGMRGLITTIAAKNHRSTHSEIIKRLSESFSQDRAATGVGVSDGNLELSMFELSLIRNFRQLTSTKQQALLGLMLTYMDLGLVKESSSDEQF
jgi:hypothetical protein